MAGGFGRKGIAAGAPGVGAGGGPPGSNVRSPASANPHADLSQQALAFIAAERARSAEQRPSTDPMASAAASAMRVSPSKPKSDRSMVLAYVLWWFASPLAAHRFYLGATRSALAMLGLFWGGLGIAAMMSKKSTIWIGGYAVPPPGIAMILICMVWIVVDAFLIPGLMRKRRAAQRSENLTHVFA